MQIPQRPFQGVFVMPGIMEPVISLIPVGTLWAVIYVWKGTIVQEEPYALCALQIPTTVFQGLSHQLHAVSSVWRRQTEELKPQGPRVLPRSAIATLGWRSVLYKTLRLLITRMLALVVMQDTHLQEVRHPLQRVVHAVPGIIKQIRTQHRARYARPGSRLREFLRQQYRVSIASREVSDRPMEP
jgi:hypothetical protein